MNIADAIAAFSANPAIDPIQVTDTAANCATYLESLQTLAASNKISKLTISDTQSLNISYTQLTACPGAVALLPATRRLVVTGTPAAAAATVQANSRVMSFSVTDSSAQIAKNFTSLNGRTRMSAIVTTDTTPLALAAAQFTACTFARALMPAGTRYTITKASVAEAVAIQTDPSVIAIAVADTNANIVARLCDLAAAPAVLGSIKATDMTMVAMSQATLLGKAAAVTALGPTLAVTVTGVDTAHLATVGAFAAVRAMSLADTAAAIAAAAASINAAAKATTLKAVSVTDGRLIELTAATYKANTSLRLVLDASARLSVSGVTAAAAAATQADATVATFTIRDSATNIASNLAALSNATKIGLVTLSSGTVLTLTADAYAANTAALSHLAAGLSLTVNNASAAAGAAILADARVGMLTVSDTWANVRNGLSALHNDTRIGRIVLTDTAPVTVDATTYIANRPVLARVVLLPGQMTVTGLRAADLPQILIDNRVGQVTVQDDLAHVVGNLDYLATLARAGTLAAVTVHDSDQTMTLTPDEIAAGAPSLTLMNQVAHASTTSTVLTQDPPLFNLMWDSSVAAAPDGFVAAVEYAARSLDAVITSHVTVNVVISYGQLNNTALGSGVLGATSYNTMLNVGFSRLQDAYAHHNGSSATAAALANMTAPANGAPVQVIGGQAKVLGLLPAMSNAIDARIGFGADPYGTRFSYDPNNRAVSGKYDFISVATHELTHALGRSSVMAGVYTGLDMFRYSAPGVRAEAGTASYFSMDGGVTRLADFAAKGNGDWATTAGTDTFAASANPGLRYDVSATDVNVLASLGYRVSASAPTVDPVAIDAARGLAAPELSFIGTPDMTTVGAEGASLAFAMKPAAGVHEIAGFQYGRDQLRLDTTAMPGNLIAYDSLIDGQHAITLTSTADTSFGVILTGVDNASTAGDLMLSHLTKSGCQALIG